MGVLFQTLHLMPVVELNRSSAEGFGPVTVLCRLLICNLCYHTRLLNLLQLSAA